MVLFDVVAGGATKPVSKCVVLSVWAHVILLGCAYVTNWFPVPVGLPQGDGEVHVQWISETAEGVDATESMGLIATDSFAQQTPRADAESMIPTAPSADDCPGSRERHASGIVARPFGVLETAQSRRDFRCRGATRRSPADDAAIGRIHRG